MRVLPSSRSAFGIRLSVFDSVCAVFSPVLALYLRDAPALSYEAFVPALLYCSLSVVFCLIAFSAFRIHAGMTRYFSVLDAIDVAKAVTTAALITYVAVFMLTRLDGIPRTTPIIHALILLTALTGIRIFTRLSEAKRTAITPRKDVAAQHILMIGSNRLSFLYIKFIRAYSPSLHRIMAVLDDCAEMLGRAIGGVRVIGPVHHLEAVINEFAEHGIRIGRVIVGNPEMLSENTLAEIRSVCCVREIKLDFVPELIGLHNLQPLQPDTSVQLEGAEQARLAPSPYFLLKRYLDLFVTMVIIVLLAPLWLLIGTIASLDVGSPVFFWQQRLGEGGRPFLLHKIRTLKPPYDWRGRKIPDDERLSPIGRFLRKCRFDEVPQLLNVLVGDMSLIGPRPLLPRDQPVDPSVRLSVRPGITGWAQVNGGNLLSVEEKNALDEWYVRNASLGLELRIIFMTLQHVFRGERRSEMAIALARANPSRQRVTTSDQTLIFPVPAARNVASARAYPF
jgi:lipopolysaccharide/colanic/teichoic acid biosynthesis glycosyltransferase